MIDRFECFRKVYNVAKLINVATSMLRVCANIAVNRSATEPDTAELSKHRLVIQ